MPRPGAVVLALAVTLAGCDRSVVGPAGCPVAGIDVSRHQGAIDWPRVAAAGIRFAWIKATEGGDYRDPAFGRNWELAEAAGVRRGAYHFVYWCRPAKDQGNWFVAFLVLHQLWNAFLGPLVQHNLTGGGIQVRR